MPPPPEPSPAAAPPDEATHLPLRIEDWLTVIVMALLALITFANVVVRYLTNQSFAWTEEISVHLMIVLALVAGSAAVARNRHIRIEFFADAGPAPRRRALARFASLMTALMFLLLAVLSARMVYDHLRFGDTSPGIGVPQWWYSIWLPLLSLVIAGRALGRWRRETRAGGDAARDAARDDGGSPG